MPNSRQELVRRIYDGIKNGSLVSGDRLPPEREIASALGASRTAVREALIVLDTLGFIETRGREGIYLRRLGEGELNRSLDFYSSWPTSMLPQTFQVRILLESEAAGLAASHRTEEDIQRMGYCIQSMARIYRERPADWNMQGSDVNDLFHKLVIEASHNEVLLRIHEGLLRIIKKASSTFGVESMITPLDQWEERIIKGHRIIMEAIEKMDEKAARDLMRRHLAITAAKLNAFYAERIEHGFSALSPTEN
ncbi:MAG: FCD domain-containing protein [Synergistaceae bacterium]|jgi:GntR family transcriptional repressor for pyruvate dehydrogenase complex|nr:FCD domain-containing protein [Synergistaceae bacterium]